MEKEENKMAFIEIKDLTKIYKQGESEVRALDGVDLNIEEGEFVAILGPSGSGKSTMLHLLGGLDNATSGSLTVNGKTILAMENKEQAVYRRKTIGFVFQSFQLLDSLTVEENIEMPVLIDGGNMDEAKKKELLDALELTSMRSRFPSQLSGGQRQRVAIARALSNDPELILADEPTGNLDTKTGDKVIDLLQDTCKKYHKTLVMITHNEEIAGRADRVVRILNGKLYE